MSPPCPLCGQPTRHRFTKNGYDIVRCTGCRLAHVEPIPSDEALAGIYDGEDFYEYTPIGRSTTIDATSAERTLPAGVVKGCDELLADAQGRLGRKGSLLEIGCGNGGLLMRGREHGWDVHGLETSQWAVEFDRGTLGLDVRRGVLEGNPYAGELFDVLVAIHSLEHMPRPVASLREARKLVAPGGLFFVSVPNDEALPRRLLGHKWRVFVPPSHLWYFNRRNLTEALRQAGFRVVHADTRTLKPGEWRDDSLDTTRGDLPSAAETGLIDPGSPREVVKRMIRAPLQWLWLLESLNVWAVPD